MTAQAHVGALAIAGVVITFCVVSLGIGFLVPRWLKVDRPQSIASAFEVSVTYFLSNPDEDLDRVQRQRDYVAMLATTETHLSGIDVGSLCPDTIDVVIDLLKMVRAQAVSERTARTTAGLRVPRRSAGPTPPG